MPPAKVKLEAFGRILLAERTAARWEVYDLGHDGKRRLANDIVVPDFIEDTELDTFIADLLHESATARHAAVRRLPPDPAGDAPVLRRFREDDVPEYRTFRLAALAESTHAFGASPEEEAGLSLEQLGERIVAGVDSAAFAYGAFAANGELIGTCGFYRERSAKVRHIGWIWGMFVERRYRRCGLGRELLGRIVADARALAGLRQIQLRVGSENTVARALYASHGFERAAVLPRSLCCDGIYIDELLMVLGLALPT